MQYKGFTLRNKVQTFLALLGAFLLVPSVFAFYGFYEALFVLIVPIFVEGGGNAAVIAGAISELLIRQAATGMVCILGLVLSSVLVFRFKYSESWFKITTKIAAVVMLFTLPFMFLLGVYTFYLSVKIRTNAKNKITDRRRGLSESYEME